MKPVTGSVSKCLNHLYSLLYGYRGIGMTEEFMRIEINVGKLEGKTVIKEKFIIAVEKHVRIIIL